MSKEPTQRVAHSRGGRERIAVGDILLSLRGQHKPPGAWNMKRVTYGHTQTSRQAAGVHMSELLIMSNLARGEQEGCAYGGLFTHSLRWVPNAGGHRTQPVLP
jgi:hypothetical protein